MAHTDKTLILFLAALALNPAQAQNSPQTLAPVVISAAALPAPPPSALISLGDAPLAAMPLSATVVSSQDIQALGAKRLADLTQRDASTSDAYNAVGYWDYLTVRGFVIDNQYNYRREGLPISAQTFIPLDNKANVEFLKGTSGMQAGVSAPGGLVNYTVKRPTATPLRSLRLEANSHGSLGAALDWSERVGSQFGYRINAAVDKLDNYPSHSRGKRQLLAVAGDWRASADTLVQAEVEYSHRSQISVPGLSLLGSAGTLPTPDARLNINSQAWSQPVVLDGLTGSLALKHAIDEHWRWHAQLGAQSLSSQDRGAFPFGCSKEGAFGIYDRYCSDGTFDLYDFRSANERRRSLAATLALKGTLETARLKHSITLSLLRSHASDTLQTQAYNPVGQGSIYAPTPLAGDATPAFNPANRRERSTELAVSDVIAWNPAFTTWAGLRLTQLHRASALTDGALPTAYSARLAAPWLAASYQLAPSSMVYASYGQGLESEVTPNRAEFANAGQVLPSAKSQQVEIGFKSRSAQFNWQAAIFSIKRPAYGNANAATMPCDVSIAGHCTRQRDGHAQHRGIELSAATSSAQTNSAQPWQLDGGITVLQAQRQASRIDPSLNGLRPSNVPRWIARINGQYRVQSQPGLALHAHVSHEAVRAVLADNSVNLPAWTRLDLSAHYDTQLGASPATWTLGIDNALNKRYFKESPSQYGHVYLLTGAPRTVRIALQMAY